MPNEILNSPKAATETTGYDELKEVKFAGEKVDKGAEIIEALKTKRPNYTQIVKDLKELDSPEVTEKAFNTERTGAPLLFLYHAEKYMPSFYDDESKIPSIERDLKEALVSKTIQDHPNTENSPEDYEEAIDATQELWKRSHKLIQPDDRAAWRQTLCVNALSESAGADTREAIKIMQAISHGFVDFSKPRAEVVNGVASDARRRYMFNDPRVRALVLRYSRRGPEFYRSVIGDSPSEGEQKLLEMELARRKARDEKLAQLASKKESAA